MIRIPGMRLVPCAWAVVACVIAACAPTLQSPGSARPHLASLSPDSVRLIAGNVIEVELRGARFDTSRTDPGNTVRIGLLVLRSVPSRAGGTRIRVAIPDAVPSGGEAPPAPWMGGRYSVSVTTRAGTSETLQLAIMGQGSHP